jgi:hypothetical protein
MFLLDEIKNDLRPSLAAMQVAADTGHHLHPVGWTAFRQGLDAYAQTGITEPPVCSADVRAAVICCSRDSSTSVAWNSEVYNPRC